MFNELFLQVQISGKVLHDIMTKFRDNRLLVIMALSIAGGHKSVET